MAGVEHSLVTKVVIANQMIFFSADRTGMGHFIPFTITLYIIFFNGVPYSIIGRISVLFRFIYIGGTVVSVLTLVARQPEGTKAAPESKAGVASGKIPECALPHPNRVPEQLPFFDKAGNREGEFPGNMR
jgi:hypothetical protein